MNNENIDLDLSVSDLPSKRVRLPDGSVIEIVAPSFESLIRLGSLLKSWRKTNKEKIEGQSVSAEDLMDQIEDFSNKIKGLIPQIKDKELTIDHLMKIVNLAISLAKPADMKELERRGIEVKVDTEKKSID